MYYNLINRKGHTLDLIHKKEYKQKIMNIKTKFFSTKNI